MIVQKINQLIAARSALFPLNAQVNIFGVFPIDNHVQFFGAFVGRRRAVVILTGTNTGVEIKNLPQGYVERSNAAANGSREGAFNRHAIFPNGREGVFGEILIGSVDFTGFVARIDLEPGDFALTTVGLFDRRIKHALAGGPKVNARAIAANEGNDRVVGDDRLTVFKANFFTDGGGRNLVVHGCAKNGLG